MLTRPLVNLSTWSAYFRDAEIPVLPQTIQMLDVLRADEDKVDANTLASVIVQDPLMLLKVLAYVARNRSSRVITDTETATAAVLLIGIPPFFRIFDNLISVDDHLQDHPDAMEGLHALLRRAHQAAQWALSFAVHRVDPDAEIIHEAALLHDFTELLLWCHAPTLAMEIRRLQRANPSLRTLAVQKAVLHIELDELQLALMRIWRLPELLIRITDHHRTQDLSVRNVLLAVQLARHSQNGWDNPAIPDDIAAISALLHLAPAVTRERVMALAE